MVSIGCSGEFFSLGKAEETLGFLLLCWNIDPSQWLGCLFYHCEHSCTYLFFSVNLSLHNLVIQVLQSPGDLFTKNIKTKKTNKKNIALKKISIWFGKDSPYLWRYLHFCNRKEDTKEENCLGWRKNFSAIWSHWRQKSIDPSCAQLHCFLRSQTLVGRGILALSNPSPCHTTSLFFTLHSPLPFLI